jgi:hypothetical protein
MAYDAAKSKRPVFVCVDGAMAFRAGNAVEPGLASVDVATGR